MKKMVTVTTCLILGIQSIADEVRQPYIIQRGDEIIAVHNMPVFIASEPISNSFVYINGEYIESPYVVSLSNLTVLINGKIIQNYEPWIHNREWYTGRVGATPENVGSSIDLFSNHLVNSLTDGVLYQFYNGGRRTSGMGDGSFELTRIELARKAIKGNEQAKQKLIQEMRLENSLSIVHPDWIERLANNTNLETRATAIIEAKREKERLERERREQMNKKDEKKP